MNSVDKQIFEGYKKKLVDNFYALLCARENKENWERFLDSILLELAGQEPYINSINYWKIRAKAGTLKYLSFFYFRATIFECISLLKGLTAIEGDEDELS